ncbi:MAG: poly(R)-hydroxyalkanoic acid synthase subunit PhaE [Candidatus Rifleibacteriota bacterium]
MFTMGEDMMKQWTENWEKLMGDHLEKLVHNEKFINEMSKSIAATMTGKAFYSKAMDEQMAALNMPSRTDVIKIMQKLTDVEERLIDLGERFEDYVEEQQKARPIQNAQSAATKPTAAKSKKSKSSKGKSAKK